MSTASTPVTEDVDPFDFLFPASVRQPRFRLDPPDLFESSWSVWDKQQKITLCRSSNPRGCVNDAIRIAAKHGFSNVLT